MTLDDYEKKTVFVTSSSRNFETYPNPMNFTVEPPKGNYHSNDVKGEGVYIRCVSAVLPSGQVDGTARNTADVIVEATISATDTASDVADAIVAETASMTDATATKPTDKVSLRNTSPGITAAINGGTFVSVATGSVFTAQNGTDSVPTISVIDCPAGAFTSNGVGDYFRIYTPDSTYVVWFNVTDGTTTAPTGATGTLVQVDITTGSTPAQVATALASAFSSIGKVAASTTNIVDITNDNNGAVASPIGATYVAGANRAMVITQRGTAGTPQILTLVTDTGSSFDSTGLGSYFIFSSDTTDITVWFDVDSGNTAVDTIRLATTASTVNDYYTGAAITITSGTGSGQTRCITQYYGTSQVAVVNKPWLTAPTNSSVYLIQPILSLPYVLIDVAFHDKPIRGIISPDYDINSKTSFVMQLAHDRAMDSDIPFVHAKLPSEYHKADVEYGKKITIVVRKPDGSIIDYIDDTSSKSPCYQTSFCFELTPIRVVDSDLYRVKPGPARMMKGGAVSSGP